MATSSHQLCAFTSLCGLIGFAVRYSRNIIFAALQYLGCHCSCSSRFSTKAPLGSSTVLRHCVQYVSQVMPRQSEGALSINRNADWRDFPQPAPSPGHFGLSTGNNIASSCTQLVRLSALTPLSYFQAAYALSPFERARRRLVCIVYVACPMYVCNNINVANVCMY